MRFGKKTYRKRYIFLLLTLSLLLICVTPMLSGLYTYSRTHVEVERENIQYASVKNTLVTQQIYCEGKISNLGISFYAPSDQLYGDAEVSITVTQEDYSVTDRVKAAKLRTLSFYEIDYETQREEDSRYEMTYIMRSNLEGLSEGAAIVSVISEDLPQGTDLFCEVSSTVTSGLPSAYADENYLNAPVVLEYDVLYLDDHFVYETVLLTVLMLLIVISAWILVYRKEWLEKYELLYWLAVATIITVVGIRNPYASFYGEPRSEATYEFWYKAENLGLWGSMMSLMSGEALAWWERILMWIANFVSPRKYVFVTAQMMELVWIALVTAMPCRRTFRRFFRDEIRLPVALLFGTALLFDSAYYFWSCSYWALFFILMFPLLELDKMKPVWYWLGIALTVVLCVSRIYHILFIPVAVVAAVVLGKRLGRRYTVYFGTVAAASAVEVIYSLTAGTSLTAGGCMLQDFADIGLGRMIENTLYYQIQVINSYLTGAEHWQGSGVNILSGLLLVVVLVYFFFLLVKKKWAKACWLGCLGLISLGSIAINVYTCGSHAAVSFPLNYASPVNWGENVYQEADLHFTYAYICLTFIFLTLAYWAKKWAVLSVIPLVREEYQGNTTKGLATLFCALIIVLCCLVSNFGVKARLTYDRITVEWKPSYAITNNGSYFLAVNTFYGATPISLEQGTDEMVFGVNSDGALYEWYEGMVAYEMDLPYHKAEIGAISQSEQRQVLAVTARRAFTNFDVKYVAVLYDRNGKELARVPQAQTERRLWLDFLLEEPVSGVYSVSFELSDGSPAYIQDGMQIGYILEEIR